MYVSLCTDDLLIACPSKEQFIHFAQYLKQYYDLSVQTGDVLNFVSMRIIQTDLGISIDQGAYCLEIVKAHFPITNEDVHRASTPLRYDKDYWFQLSTSPPLTPIQNRENEIKYNGSYRHHIGCLQYLATHSRFDINQYPKIGVL